MPSQPDLSLVLGCSKCRYSSGGCKQCRDPAFAGKRGKPGRRQHAEPTAQQNAGTTQAAAEQPDTKPEEPISSGQSGTRQSRFFAAKPGECAPECTQSPVKDSGAAEQEQVRGAFEAQPAASPSQSAASTQSSETEASEPGSQSDVGSDVSDFQNRLRDKLLQNKASPRKRLPSGRSKPSQDAPRRRRIKASLYELPAASLV